MKIKQFILSFFLLIGLFLIASCSKAGEEIMGDYESIDSDVSQDTALDVQEDVSSTNTEVVESAESLGSDLTIEDVTQIFEEIMTTSNGIMILPDSIGSDLTIEDVAEIFEEITNTSNESVIIPDFSGTDLTIEDITQVLEEITNSNNGINDNAYSLDTDEVMENVIEQVEEEEVAEEEEEIDNQELEDLGLELELEDVEVNFDETTVTNNVEIVIPEGNDFELTIEDVFVGLDEEEETETDNGIVVIEEILDTDEIMDNVIEQVEEEEVAEEEEEIDNQELEDLGLELELEDVEEILEETIVTNNVEIVISEGNDFELTIEDVFVGLDEEEETETDNGIVDSEEILDTDEIMDNVIEQVEEEIVVVDPKFDKQKSLYIEPSYSKSLDSQNTYDVEVSVSWESLDDLRNYGNRGIYEATTIGIVDGPSGYFGAQVFGKGSSNDIILFSFWDSGSMAVPINDGIDGTCKRNCQDGACGGSDNGTKCTLKYPMEAGVDYTMRMQRTEEFATVDSQSGSVWQVSVTNEQTQVSKIVGKMLFVDVDKGIKRMKYFHEHIGLTPCQAFHIKANIRPKILDSDNKIKSAVATVTGGSEYTCQSYDVSGDKDSQSFIFETGGGIDAGFERGEDHPLF